ncbi:DinB family protein [uncultured Psychroserpens sp.]|uniref:DinB family protein n=1 Tax=uncultured Psychroserpens sp. TaxID=255436 RepID=UPI002626F5F5|nr:DinB family protein [uncultured Psychroserpens sp.]
MLTDTLIKLFTRDLNALKKEINSYKYESKLWLVAEDISNSGGNLCLHLVGNLNHFIGATMGDTGYVRQRDLEFSLKDVPRTELIKQVDDTIAMVEKILKTLTETDLQNEYKRRVFEDAMTTEYFLVHLSMHLAYHLGQINYHRRLLDA